MVRYPGGSNRSRRWEQSQSPVGVIEGALNEPPTIPRPDSLPTALPLAWDSTDLRSAKHLANRWAQRDSNPRHLPCKGSALAN